jgi:hypothetical protein
LRITADRSSKRRWTSSITWDSLLPGLAWEHITIEPTPDPDDFRIVRDDFDAHATSTSSKLPHGRSSTSAQSPISSTEGRQRPGSTAHPHRSRTILRRHANEREFILNELPAARAFYSEIRRHSRNAFGHYNLEYDFAHGELIDQRDGSRTSFLLFLADYLEAARMTSYLITVAEKLSLAIEEPGGFAAHAEAVEGRVLRDRDRKG